MSDVHSHHHPLTCSSQDGDREAIDRTRIHRQSYHGIRSAI